MRHKFEEIAINSTTKKKPTPSDKDIYLGLEHLDSGSLTVTRFGSEVAPIGEKLIMKKGDVLFGKRRAYQKKVAIAPFDGIFSAHGMVLRPNERVVDKRFFPLFISSDYFLDAAIKISVGSLSPTINWSTLKDLEFELPKIGEQARLADLLWAANSSREAYKMLLAKTDELVKSRFVEMFGDELNPYAVELNDICRIITDGTHQPPKFINAGIPFIFVSNIVGNEITYDTDKFIAREDYEVLIKRTPIEVGDILITTVGSYGNPAIVRSQRAFCFQRHIAYMKPKQEQVNSVYLHVALLSNAIRKQIEVRVKGIAQKTLNLSELKTIKVNLPPLELQNSFADFVRQTDKSKFELQRAIDELDATYKSLLREKLG